ncbi:MAG: hypothetical protein ACM3U2_13000 [Deltaproteobacteria bacterium]
MLRRSSRPRPGGSLAIPNVAFLWPLIGPDGKVGWESSTTVGWAAQSSKYFQGAKLDSSKFPEPGTIGPARIEKLDFGKRDFRTAIIEEQLEKPRKALDVPEQLPARLLKAGGSHKDLPAMETVKIECFRPTENCTSSHKDYLTGANFGYTAP